MVCKRGMEGEGAVLDVLGGCFWQRREEILWVRNVQEN